MLKVKLLKESLLHTKILSAFQTKMYVLLSLLYFKLALKFHTLSKREGTTAAKISTQVHAKKVQTSENK